MNENWVPHYTTKDFGGLISTDKDRPNSPFFSVRLNAKVSFLPLVVVSFKSEPT